MIGLIVGILVVFVVAMSIYIVTSIVYSATGVQDLATTVISLDKASNLLDSEQTRKKIFNTGGSTIAGFFNVRLGNRSQGSALVQLISIQNSLMFLVGPSKTELRVRTPTGLETIDLPPFPQQSWVFLAILRDGRRFDVLYNDRIVASRRLDQYPVLESANSLSVGSTQLLGQAIHVVVNDRRLSPKEIAHLRASMADTNGAPIQESTFPMPSLFSITLKNLQVECIPGLPCNPVTAPPVNRAKSWSSLYN